jgi:hypothetical protein
LNFFSDMTGVWNQGFILANQALYHLSLTFKIPFRWCWDSNSSPPASQTTSPVPEALSYPNLWLGVSNLPSSLGLQFFYSLHLDIPNFFFECAWRLITFPFSFYFIIFTFTYMCVHCLCHFSPPPLHPQHPTSRQNLFCSLILKRNHKR